MKKLYFFSIVFLISNFTLFANPVDSIKAQNVAQIFLQQKSITTQGNNPYLKNAKRTLQLTKAVTKSKSNEFYIFNVENEGGFIIVSAEDCATPVLGYGIKGSFDPNNVPENMQNWLEGYKQQIQYAIDNHILPSEDIKAQWDNLQEGTGIVSSSESAAAVGPLLETTWNQSPYYNDLCPYDDNGQAVTGCVATAMAQVMKYWNYPSTGSGSHSYTDDDCGEQSADFASTTYDWDNMPNILTGSSTVTEVEAVATLMYHCGVSVEMDYSSYSSGAYVIYTGWWSEYCAENALVDYFGYKSSLQGLLKNDYSETGWIQMLESEIDAGRPVLYSGYTSGPNTSGHAFVCDGYDEDEYFHFNWGWGGSGDGFFTLDALQPDQDVFSTDQRAIMGIEPDITVIEGIDLTYNSSSNSLTVNDTKINLDIEVKNNGTQNSGAFNVAFYLSNNSSVTTSDYLIGTKSVSGLNSGSTISLNLLEDVATITPEIPEGDYYIGYIIDYQNTISEANESNNSYVFSKQVELYRLPNLTYNASKNSFTINNYDVTINLQAINNDDYDSDACSIGYFLSSDRLLNVTKDYLLGTVSLKALGSGETSDKTFSVNVLEKFPDLPEGNYYLCYYIDYQGSVEESNEADNYFVYTNQTLQHTLYPNLTYDTENVNIEILTSSINFNIKVLNNGEKTSPTCNLGCYMSTNSKITTSDFLLESISLEQISAGSSVIKIISIDIESIGDNLNEGNYYLGFIIDNNENVTELDETDNICVFTNEPYYYCRPSLTLFDTIICKGESVIFEHEEFTESGTYEFAYSSQTGCDSVVVLNLTVNPTHLLELNQTICRGDSVIIGTTVYSESGNYTQSLINQYGCDSIIHLNLEVVEPTEVFLTESICLGDSIKIAGMVYKETGIYTHQLTSSDGCDSTVTLNLAVYPKSDTLLSKNICSGESIIVGDSVYNVSGIYTNLLTNRFGCDSLVTLDLTVNPSYKIILENTICEGDTLWLDEKPYYETGTYENLYTTGFGCDSLIILNLIVNPVNDTLLSVALCAGDSVQIGNSYYSETGVYVVNLKNQFGCDSIVTLDLTVNRIDEIILDETICEGDSIVVGFSVYKTSGSYINVLSNRFGCDSTVNLTLTVNPVQEMEIYENICEGSVYNFGEMQYNESGTYTYTFSNRYGCDSTVTLFLNVVALPEVNLGDDCILFSSEDKILDAGPGFEGYQWNTGETTQEINISSARGLGVQNYSVTVTNYYQCSSSDEIRITIYDDSSMKEEKPLLKLFPNPSNGIIQVLIGDITGKYSIKISSEKGNLVYDKEFYSSDNKFLKTLNLSYLRSGYYMLRIISDKETASEKLVIVKN